MTKFTRMRTLLKPKRGKRFSLVNDHVTGDTLLIDNKELYVVMSDSKYEQELNSEIIEKAHGDVLSLGFGIGFILQPLMKMDKVKTITIIEKEQEVLDLVASQLVLNDKVRVILGDALNWTPDMPFDIIYEDCDYSSKEITQAQLKYNQSDNSIRLAPWLKPDGEFIRFGEPKKEGFYV